MDVLYNYLKELEADDSIIGILLFGSYARGDNRPDSDIDLLVIQKEGAMVRKVEIIDGSSFEMVWNNAADTLSYWKKDLDRCYNIWHDAKIMFDKDGTMEMLKSEAQKIITQGKSKLSDLTIKQRRFDADHQVSAAQALYLNDQTSAVYTLQTLMGKLVELYFDIRQQWIPTTKKKMQTIRSADPETYECLNTFYTPESNFEDMIEASKQFIEKVFQVT